MIPRFVWPEQPEGWRDHLPRGRRLGKEQEIGSMVSDICKLEIYSRHPNGKIGMADGYMSMEFQGYRQKLGNSQQKDIYSLKTERNHCQNEYTWKREDNPALGHSST